MKGNWGRAFKVIAGVLGASFFSAAFRRLLNFSGGGAMANAGVTLASTVLLFAGLKAFKWTQAANAVFVGGLIVVGLELLAKPVTEAGTKVGGWLRGMGDGFGNGNGNGGLQTQVMPQGYQEPQTFSYQPQMQALPAGPAPGIMPAASQQSAPQPQNVTIIQEAQKTNPWIDLASTGLQVGGQVLGSWIGNQQYAAGQQDAASMIAAALGSGANPNDAFAKMTY